MWERRFRGTRGRAGVGAGLAALVALAVASPPAQAQMQDSGCPDAQLLPTPETVPRVQKAMVCLINVARARNRLAAVRQVVSLDRSSDFHSHDMVYRRFFAHEGKGRPSLAARVRNAGYLRGVRTAIVSENIGVAPRGNDHALALVNAWLSTPEHRANILDERFRDVGVGEQFSGRHPVFYADHASTVFTTDFGRRYRPVRKARRYRCRRVRRRTTSKRRAPRYRCSRRAVRRR